MKIHLILLFFSFSIFSCMTGSAGVVRKELNYPEYSKNIKKVVPRVQIQELDKNQAIELSVWSNIEGVENDKSISVINGNKLHIIKHKETTIFPTAFEGVLYNENDTLICSVVSDWGDPTGYSKYILDVAIGGKPISSTKSYWAYNSLALLSSTAGFYYISKNNPLISEKYFKKWQIVHAVGDIAVLIGVIGIFTDNKTMITGGFGFGIPTKIFNIFENQYIAEYNGYSYSGE